MAKRLIVDLRANNPEFRGSWTEKSPNAGNANRKYNFPRFPASCGAFTDLR